MLHFYTNIVYYITMKTTEKAKKRTVQIVLTDELYEKSHEKAEKCDTNLSQVVRRLLSQWLTEKQQTLNFI